MIAQLDINTLASWATVAVAIAAGGRFLRKGSNWFEGTNRRLDKLEKGQTALEKCQAATQEQVQQINAQLRPNGGHSHHDVVRREIREVAEEVAAKRKRKSWW